LFLQFDLKSKTMKKKMLVEKLLAAIIGSSYKKEFDYSGNCIICGKETMWNSTGFCNKHYTLEKEKVWREIKPKRKVTDLSNR